MKLDSILLNSVVKSKLLALLFFEEFSSVAYIGIDRNIFFTKWTVFRSKTLNEQIPESEKRSSHALFVNVFRVSVHHNAD